MNQPDLFRCGGMYQKMPPPFFPWPYDPTVNPWVKYGPVSPGMVPYHQYFAPHIHVSIINFRTNESSNHPHPLTIIPQAPMSPGTMANVSPFLMMHQMHPPPVHHTLQSGAPVIGKPGQIPPMDQHQLNPGQINGAQQLQPQLMPVNHPAAPPVPALASTVHQKKNRRSRAIPIIYPGTHEDFLVNIYSDSLSARILAPPQANHSIILRNLIEISLALATGYDNIICSIPTRKHQKILLQHTYILARDNCSIWPDRRQGYSPYLHRRFQTFQRLFLPK